MEPMTARGNWDYECYSEYVDHCLDGDDIDHPRETHLPAPDAPRVI